MEESRAAVPGRRDLIRHGAAVVILDAVSLLLLAWILPGFRVDGALAAIGTAILIGLLNALIWPIVSRLTLRLAVVSLGLAGLLLNSLIVAVVMLSMPWLQIDGLFEAFAITILLSLVTSLVGSVLAFEPDSRWYLETVRRTVESDPDAESGIPGYLFLEIDGLAHDVLRRAFASGNASELQRWVRDGSHRLRRWETDWSSQTGACQAGILHGNNSEMPAFRWWEKDLGRAIVTNHPGDAAELERRQSNGQGLLANRGASRANILSGDAPFCQLTMSTVLDRRDRLGRDYAAYFARPYAVIRTFWATLAEVASELASSIRARRAGVEPSIHRGFTYAFMRAWATVIQLDLQVSSVIADLMAGRPAIYTTFLAYDEVAHHSGIERPESLSALRRVNRAIGRLARAAEAAPRPYHLVVLSDHGQSQGATFLQRYGISLEDLVTELCGLDASAETGSSDEAGVYLRASLAEASGEESLSGKTIKAAGGERVTETLQRKHTVDTVEVPPISVMASGNLGIVSFPRQPGRASLEWIENEHPGLIAGLSSHPGIGFLLVRSDSEGAVAIGGSGRRLLERDRVVGEDPLAPFGPNAADHVLRTSSFSNCPDILVNSTYWDDLDEVAAFEELVGSHGGMGGTQSFPFLLHPSSLPFPSGGIVGAEGVYRLFKGWEGNIDQAIAVESPGDRTRTSVAGA